MTDQPDLEALATDAHALAVRNGLIQSDSLARAVLAAVLPAHEQMVREAAAGDVEHLKLGVPDGPDAEAECAAYDHAAAYIRGQG